MKASLFFGFVSLALLPLCAEELQINVTHKQTVTDDQTFTISNGTLNATLPPVLTAKITFTIPSVSPEYKDFENEKLAIVCDTNGEILIADGETDTWKSSGYIATEGTEVPIKAAGKFVNDILKFDVTIGTATPVEVTAPTSDTTLTELTLTGEGTAKDITLTVVNTNIIPVQPSGYQDADQTAKYATWLNTTGSTMSGTDAERSDAFAMNVGGTPKLEITAITPATDSTPGSITVKGYYTQGETTHETSLKDINGILYITWSETLTGEATITTKNITVNANGTATVELPENAKFVKATVSLVAPDTTEPTSL